MNFLEAAKSGKLFRNKKWRQDCFVKVAGETFESVRPDGRTHRTPLIDFLDASQFLDDDWEIQEPTATITRTQFFEAVRWVLEQQADWALTYGGPCREINLDALADKLGLVEK